MRFSCTKENLSQALSLVGGISSKNINLPILNNVLQRDLKLKQELEMLKQRLYVNNV
jgi:DNA polymerase III sliding clamp (beta) subunit (PCNA family)